MPIDLKSQLTLLRSLQDIYISLHQVETELAKIPQKIEDAKSEFLAAKDIVTQKMLKKADIEKKHRDGTGELEASIAHIKDRETKLYAIKTNKEYQAAIKEIADAKQSNKDREDQILGLMEQIEALNKETTQLSEKLADNEKVFNEKEAELKKTETALLADKEKELEKLKDAELILDGDILKQYRFIQKRYSDAMAIAVGGVCKGCYKRIPPQVYIELQKWAELITCPNCHRILFFEEVPVVNAREDLA